MTMSGDSTQRQRALDPDRSFIVQAPAGSGKTELLIQRFLRLLARIERPEQIVAITFTRKAAAEMRERVVETLKLAATPEASSPEHRQASIALARDALAHARDCGWSLLDQPRRLRIMTIDALNTGLARQLPILASGIASLAVTDDTSELYTAAARRTLESLAEPGPLGRALRTLLADSDNSLSALELRLASSLPQRDRWLRAIAEAGSDTLAGLVGSTLAELEDVRLGAVRDCLGRHDEASLGELINLSAASQTESEPQPAEGQAVAASMGAWQWRAAARLLLTEKGEWRKRFTRREGFPADDKALRGKLDGVLAALHAKDGLRDSLAAFAALPPRELGPTQTARLNAIEVVLPRLLAELRVLFTEAGGVDHTELSLAAQQALGGIEAPSELLLALDRRIEHILVDEFQDTSRLQWRLLERLTAGWQPGDGRTLFLVGDPMQSIYRFRDADLTLFLRARREGLGNVSLVPIELKENHRSAAEIVDWINATFGGVFPSEPDGDENPGFSRSLATQPPDPGAGVELTVLADQSYASEIARVVEIVRAETARRSDQSIGILVRSRIHLLGLRAALRHAGVAAHAIEIDSLTDTQLGQDLIGLTQALTHPGDRLAWLGVLRSPWCGLSWSDVMRLCDDDGDTTVFERLGDTDCLARLSDDGRRRAEWLAGRLRHAFSLRATRAFGRWIRDCWRMIDGPATLADAAALDSAERYFADLDRLARFGDVDDPAMLREVFGKPGPDAGAAVETGIEIMTMHRAKGLEFDCVILPALGRVVRGSENKLLFNIDLYTPSGRELTLLAAGAQNGDPSLDFIAQIERERDAAERCRLLYVAATRTRRRLYLVGSVDPKSRMPKAGSLLATLWPGLGDSPAVASAPDLAGAGTAQTDPAQFVPVALRRLTFDIGLPDPFVPSIAGDEGGRPPFEWVHPASVQVGTLIHAELQRLADAAAAAGRPVPPLIDVGRYRRQLALLGVETEDLGEASRRVAEALDKVWADSKGRWILEPRPLAWTELRLTLRDGDRLEHIQLDRSFVDEKNRRWIIDYKTGRHLGGKIEEFLDAEVERYQPQLERYARAVAGIDTRPLRVGLYFPLMGELRSWDPAIPDRGGGGRSVD